MITAILTMNPSNDEMKKYRNIMEYLFQSVPALNSKADDLIEGTVLKKIGSVLFIDIDYKIGVVYGKEYFEAKDIIKNLRTGDKIIVKILNFETPRGYTALSLKEASKDVVWREIEEYKNERRTINAVVIEANKGGLILEWKSLKGFLPTSNLKINHYPRVEGGDKVKILEELKKLIGQQMQVVITDINYKDNTMIFSEKSVKDEGDANISLKYKVGDIIESEVSGIVDFGIFIKIDERIEGLVHISELDWSLIESPSELFKVGDKIKAKIIDIENNKISLSIKALKKDPWEESKDEFHKGDIVKGVVIRFNKHGALISVKEGIAGLAHISQFGDEKTMKSKLELGKSYLFQITFLSPAEHRLTFGFIEEDKK